MNLKLPFFDDKDPRHSHVSRSFIEILVPLEQKIALSTIGMEFATAKCIADMTRSSQLLG